MSPDLISNRWKKWLAVLRVFHWAGRSFQGCCQKWLFHWTPPGIDGMKPTQRIYSPKLCSRSGFLSRTQTWWQEIGRWCGSSTKSHHLFLGLRICVQNFDLLLNVQREEKKIWASRSCCRDSGRSCSHDVNSVWMRCRENREIFTSSPNNCIVSLSIKPTLLSHLIRWWQSDVIFVWTCSRESREIFWVIHKTQGRTFRWSNLPDVSHFQS